MNTRILALRNLILALWNRILALGRAIPQILNRFFRITERGSTVAREVRGGVVTFFTMSYILVLNPLILSAEHEGIAPLGTTEQIAAGTALVAGVMTILMGLVANYSGNKTKSASGASF